MWNEKHVHRSGFVELAISIALALSMASVGTTPASSQKPDAAAQVATSPQSAIGPIPVAERTMHHTDPVLYAAARQYFPNDTADVPAKRLVRLTRDQLDVTARALLPTYVLASVKLTMPRDPLQTNYEYADMLALNNGNIAGLTEWIAGVAARVREKPSGVIDCGGGPSPDCLRQQARAFVSRAYRGDVVPDTLDKAVAFYLASVQSNGYAQATGDLVEVVLNSPHFLFRRELDVNAAKRLAPAQLLQAVTYTIADAPPEAVGLSSLKAAEYLRTGAEAGAIIKAIARSRPARAKLQRFFTAWLEIREPGDFTISPQVFPEFDATLASSIRDEAQHFLQAQLGRENPSLKDITQSPLSFVEKTVAALQNSRPDTAGSDATATADLSQRLGILSHPAVIASHSGPTDTRPIKRGVFWARKVMCMDLEPPPKDLHAKLYEMKGATQRQRIESSTAAPACAGCHKIINPFGFMLESYDALGRWRINDNGAPIDTSVLIDFLDEEPVRTTGTVDALRTLTSSMMFKQCFVRQLFRSYMGRRENAGDDPLLRRMLFEFAADDSQDLLRLVWMLTSSDRIVWRQ